MATKKFELTEGISVTVYKRRLSRSIKLSIAANGDVRVSIPKWLTFKAGEAFAKKQLPWIMTQRNLPPELSPGQAVGKQHRIIFLISVKALKPSSRLKGTDIFITHPLKTSSSHPDVQAVAQRAAIRALRSEAEQVLPKRLRDLAGQYDMEFKSVTIKQLTSRWGSCDQNKDIALNLFLMQLPWSLIDYVLVHELVHTKHLHHGEDFWRTLEGLIPDAKKLRAEIRKHKPVVLS